MTNYKKSIEEIKNDLYFCQKYWVIIYGSYLTDYFIPYRSDIDIAIVTKKKSKVHNTKIWKSILGKATSLYDIKIFELLPLYIKIEIINNYKVIFGDDLEISEYFYQYRKIWKDIKHRIQSNQFKDIDEKKKLMKNRKKLLI